MTELRLARRVVDAIRDGDAYVQWGPGDGTIYRVALLRFVRHDGGGALNHDEDLVALLVLVGDHELGAHLLVRAPRADYDRWTARSFVRAFGVRYAGWWPGVRPLLAALGWTGEGYASPTYDPRDAAEVVTCVAEITSYNSPRREETTL